MTLNCRFCNESLISIFVDLGTSSFRFTTPNIYSDKAQVDITNKYGVDFHVEVKTELVKKVTYINTTWTVNK